MASASDAYAAPALEKGLDVLELLCERSQRATLSEIAAALGVPEEILRRTPTTDTFSLAQTQEEFYFALPYDQMDLCL